VRWRLLETVEPFTFFVKFRPDAHCDMFTYDVCIWVPGGRLDAAQTVVHLFIGFLIQIVLVALARERPRATALRKLAWGGVPLLALLKEVYDGFAPFLLGPLPIGGSGFSALDIVFTLGGQLAALALVFCVNGVAAVAGMVGRSS